GRVKAALAAHRSAEPGIAAWIRRPHAFGQSAEDHALAMRQTRLKLTVDLQQGGGLLRAPDHAAAEGGFEEFGILVKANRDEASCSVRGRFIECREQSKPVGAVES